MDVQLKELIDRIKADGVKSAEAEAAKIIAQAESRSTGLVEAAKSEADGIRDAARADAEKSERTGREALRQAGRDLVLEVRSKIEEMFGVLVKAETGQALSDEALSAAIVAAVEGIGKGAAADIAVLLPEGRLEEIESGLKAKLKDQISAGLEIRPFRDIDAGFRVSMKDGSAFFDFSDTEIAAMLSRYLNPRLAEILKG